MARGKASRPVKPLEEPSGPKSPKAPLAPPEAEVDSGSDEHTIEFIANPIQHRFITSRAEADLFASRMGEGKSAALCWAAYHHVAENPGAVQAFIRDTWENLRDTTQREFFSWFPPGVMGEYVSSRKTFYWKIGDLRGEVMFIGMDDPKDASKLQSRALGAFFMDEPAPAADSGGIAELIFDTAMTRLRQRKINWYAAKLAENNPDESHWTYRKFVDPGTPGYVCWQTQDPENLANLPKDYYERMRRQWAGRPDLVRRFADGKFGFQRIGQAVTPGWSDELHLADELQVIKGRELLLLWDFGLTPVCVITQVAPSGHWNILEVCYDEEQPLGAYDLIQQIVKPVLSERYEECPWNHTGDPAGQKRSEVRIDQTPVSAIQRELGGRWRPGPSSIPERVNPLRWALAQVRNGTGMVRVDRQRARAVHHALRGGWHFHVARGGVVSTEPVKNHPDSDIGDAVGYGSALLFPKGALRPRKRTEDGDMPVSPGYFGRVGGGPSRSRPLGLERPGVDPPTPGLEDKVRADPFGRLDPGRGPR